MATTKSATVTALTGLTDDEAATLAKLQAKQVQATWEANEAARKSKLAALAPVVNALGSVTKLDATLAVLEAARSTLDSDTRVRVERIALILNNDARVVLATAASLLTPIPQPAT